MSDKQFMAQKYFIFKLPDILNNSFHVFEEKRMESIRLILEMCMEIYEEMHETTMGIDKLAKSYVVLLNTLKYHMERHPFIKLELFCNDFRRLCKLIEQGIKEDRNLSQNQSIYVCLHTLSKKIWMQDLMGLYVQRLINVENFGEVDTLIEYMVSELLYGGYSLNYLYEWYQDHFNMDRIHAALEKGDLCPLLNELKELDFSKNEYEVVIAYQIKTVEYKDFAEDMIRKVFGIKDISCYDADKIWHAKQCAVKKYEACDCYKAVTMAKKNFDEIRDLFFLYSGTAYGLKYNRNIGYINEGLQYIDVQKINNTKMINYYDKNRTEQMQNYIDVSDKIEGVDMDTIERILRTLHAAKNLNAQNRFLNFWSALEYAVYPFEKNSIIEKVRVVVPESFALFYIKNKMNIFWERLNYVMKKKDSDVKHPASMDFVQYCQDDKDYDTKKMIAFLQDKNCYKEMLEELDFHVILKREMMELIMLLTDSSKLLLAVDGYKESIVQDINCIYRVRNQLIHSSKSMDDSLEHISLRLYRYANSIMSTILYYKKHNAALSISEILNSLHNTYEVYYDKMLEQKKQGKEIKDGYAMVRPKYLFLE